MSGAASDVSAVVLSIGEATTGDAVRAVEAQTLAPSEIVLVEHVAPFHRALNAGAARVRTPFFVQVDADMVLDPSCFETFRAVATPRTGMVSGFLRDPMLGRICCVKMFRTECVAAHSIRDVVSHETDFLQRMLGDGWLLLRALCFSDPDPARWHSFGEHRRDYTPPYTFTRFVIEGRKARFRRNVAALRGRLSRLDGDEHPNAVIAQIGLAHGIFLEHEHDLLGAFDGDAQWRSLEAFLAHAGGERAPARPALPPTGDGEQVFRAAYRLGAELRRAGDAAAFRSQLHAAGASPSAIGWVAQVGLCQGLFADPADEAALRRCWRLLAELLSAR